LLVGKGGWEMSELLEDLAKRGLVRKEEDRSFLNLADKAFGGYMAHDTDSSIFGPFMLLIHLILFEPLSTP